MTDDSQLSFSLPSVSRKKVTAAFDGGRMAERRRKVADTLAAHIADRRDPSHNRTLSDGDLRDLFAANGLTLIRKKAFTHRRVLDSYLRLAGCTGEEAEHVKELSPGDRGHYVAESGWYLCMNHLG